jgi:hypothetical protein
LAVVRPGEERVFGEKVFNWEIRRPAVIVAKRQDKPRFGFEADDARKLARRDTAPDVIEPRPARHAMKIGVDLNRRQLHELIERPALRVFHQTVHLKLPRRQINVGRTVRVEHWPLARARLSGRQTVLAPRVRADDTIGRINLFGLARLILLIERIVEQISEKAHKCSEIVFSFRFSVFRDKRPAFY